MLFLSILDPLKGPKNMGGGFDVVRWVLGRERGSLSTECFSGHRKPSVSMPPWKSSNSV